MLLGGTAFGFFVVPLFFYVFLSPADYTSTHTLLQAYGEMIRTLSGNQGRTGRWIALAITLGPYLLFQLGRSVVWAVRTVHRQ